MLSSCRGEIGVVVTIRENCYCGFVYESLLVEDEKRKVLVIYNPVRLREMDTQVPKPASRFYISCRQVESASQPCPQLQTTAAWPNNKPFYLRDMTAHVSNEGAAMPRDL